MLLRIPTLYKEVFHLKVVHALKTKHMKYLIISVICTLFFCKSNDFSQNKKKDNLTEEDYVIINVFLEQIELHTYLDLNIKHRIDSTSFIIGYQRKVKIYESFRNLCTKNLSRNKKLNYTTNFSCSTAEEFKIYKDLFSKAELKSYSKQLASDIDFHFLIEPKQILIPNIEPIEGKTTIRNNGEILKIYGIFYNKNRVKVLIKYSINNKTLYQVLKKEEKWWKNIINF